MGAAGFGYEFNALDNQMTAAFDAIAFIVSRLAAPLQIIFPFLNKLPTEANKKLDKSFEKIEQILFDIVEKSKERRNSDTHSGEYFNVVDHIIADDVEGTLTKKSLRDNMLLFYFGGYETTSAALTSTLYFLAKYPDLQKKVYEEVITVLGKDPRHVAYEDTIKLQYLTQFIKEVLRYHSPVWGSTSRQTKQDLVIGEYLIPKGIDISPDFALMHFNPKLWDEPKKFNPDRFSDQNAKLLHPYQYSPFFLGPRACIGKKFAMLEIITAISMTMQEYEVSLIPNYVWCDAFPTIATRPRDGLPLNFTKRFTA